MENKQTAVNWMANELLYLDNEYDMKLIDKNEYQARRKQVTNQAKEMEKEQIIKAFNEGTFATDEKITAKQYYNETFKSE
jgi:hypothetical protein